MSIFPKKSVYLGWLTIFTPLLIIALYQLPAVKRVLLKDLLLPDSVIQVETIGHQWWWEFRQKKPEVTLSNELHLPEDRLITMTLTSADAIHSFWLPEIGGKIDVLPGLKSQITFRTPKIPSGETQLIMEGKCMEHCGAAHAQMRFKVYVHSEPDYSRWLSLKEVTEPSSTSL